MSVNYKTYVGDLVGGGLMIRESRLIAELLITSPDNQAWNEAIKQQNILQKSTPATATRNAETIRRRIQPFGFEFYVLLQHGSNELCAQLMMASVLHNSPILGDFMRSVIIEAKRLYRDQLEANDWADFWQERSRLFPGMAAMANSSAYKVQKMAFKCLAEAGYIQNTRQRKLQNVYLLPEVSAFLYEKKHDAIVSIMELG